MDRTPQDHQQVLHKLQRLRGDLLKKRCSARELEIELDKLWVSIAQDNRIEQIEAKQIRCLMDSFRGALSAEIGYRSVGAGD